MRVSYYTVVRESVVVTAGPTCAEVALEVVAMKHLAAHLTVASCLKGTELKTVVS